MPRIYRGIALALVLLASGCSRDEHVEYGVAVESISVEPERLELALGLKRDLIATILPADATNRNVIWTSSHPSVASVDDGGRVAGIGVGDATITATTEDGEKTDVCTVSVRKPISLEISVSGFPEFSGVADVPFDRGFDNVRVDIKGFDWQVVGSITAQVADGKVALNLPESIAGEKLCKAPREDYKDYAGWWPVLPAQLGDPEAKVAGLGDILAYSGDSVVGRLYLGNSESDTPGGRGGAAYVYFHFADRPFDMDGINLYRPGEQPSFNYEVSFSAGWNVYANIERTNSTSLCTTDLPDDPPFGWHFEVWP